MKRTSVSVICPICSVIFALYTLIFPLECAFYVRKALSICANSLIPSLFPFMFLMKFYSKTKGIGKDNIFSAAVSKLLGVDKTLAGIVALGMFAGFPSGASGICEVYGNGLCTKNSAEHGIAVSDNCSAAFLISVCGTAVLKSAKYGLILLISQTIAIVVISHILKLFENAKKDYRTDIRKSKLICNNGFRNIFVLSVRDSALSMLYVCAFVVIFYLISGTISDRFLSLSGSEKNKALSSLLTGFFEMSSGAFSCLGLEFPENVVICSAITGFSGLSVFFQICGICEESGLDTRLYLISRLFMTFLCPIFTIVILLLLPSEILCFSNNAYAVTSASSGTINLAIFIICIILFAATVFEKFIFVRFAEKKH